MQVTLPVTRKGMSVGLLGGSFDPAHSGHVHITHTALKRFGLDEVWWLVSPGNPLKTHGPAPMGKRLAVARKVMQHPRVVVTDLERQLGTTYTAETLAALQSRARGVRFVWLMGADNLAQFHHWQNWRWIMDNFAVGVLARPGDRIPARMSKTARLYRDYRLKGRAARLLPSMTAPAWGFVNMPMAPESSSKIREEGAW